MVRKYTWGAEAETADKLAEKIDDLREEARRAHDGKNFEEELETGHNKDRDNFYAILTTRETNTGWRFK